MTNKLQKKWKKSKIFGSLFDDEFDFQNDYFLDYLEALQQKEEFKSTLGMVDFLYDTGMFDSMVETEFPIVKNQN
jgi:hypothetical protein